MSNDLGLDFEIVSNALREISSDFKYPLTIQKTKTGQSNPTFIVEGKNRRKLVIRRKPNGNHLKSAHLIEREFQVMKALESTEVPVPKMYRFFNKTEHPGHEFFIMEFVDGITFSQPQTPGLTSSERRTVYDSMNLGLSSIHRIIPKKIGLGNFGKEGNYFERQLSRWSKQYELTKTEEIQEMAILQAWLTANIPSDNFEACLVHGDWRIDNLLFSREDFSLLAIIDWELSTIGDPRADLASQLMQWRMPVGPEGRGLSGIDRKNLGIPSDDEYIEQYSRRLKLKKTLDLEFPIAFCYFRMAAIMQGVKKRALEGNASNPEEALRMGKYVHQFVKSALKFLKI